MTITALTWIKLNILKKCCTWIFIKLKIEKKNFIVILILFNHWFLTKKQQKKAIIRKIRIKSLRGEFSFSSLHFLQEVTQLILTFLFIFYLNFFIWNHKIIYNNFYRWFNWATIKKIIFFSLKIFFFFWVSFLKENLIKKKV